MRTMIFECPKCEVKTNLNYEELSVNGKCQNCGVELYVELGIDNKDILSWKVYVLPSRVQDDKEAEQELNERNISS